ncbi:MAG: glutamine synthetase family protein, partial [Candidatus Korarchaeota archaeon]
MDISEIIARIKTEQIRYISLQFVDIYGNPKHVTIPANAIETAFEDGIWFDGSSVEGFARIYESDMFLRPDPDTFVVLPWSSGETKTARFIAEVYSPNGEHFEGDPRYTIKKIMNEAYKMGYIYNVGPEIEFFILNGNLQPVDNKGYFDLSPFDVAREIRYDISNTLEKLGIMAEMVHHECSPGQQEIDIKYDNAIKLADEIITTKYVIRSIAMKHNYIATFMPKPIFGVNGSGMHIHQSLFTFDGKNAFYSDSDKYNLSDIAKYFIGGQIKHIRELMGILAPTVNSYKRLVPGYEAPVYICWGEKNRSALIRVPGINVPKKKRIELRCPDPTANPYLAFAVMLAAGLDGIKKKIDPPEPIEENVYELDKDNQKYRKIECLPTSLEESLNEME